MGNNYQPGGSGGGGSGDRLALYSNTPQSITGATSVSTFDTLYQCSGTGNYPVALPAASSGPGLMGFRMMPALTAFVTITAAGSDLIDGQATRVMWANEVAELYCDGTSWTKIGGKTIPMQAKLLATGAQTLTEGSFDTLNLTSAAINIGGMADASTSTVTTLRAGVYNISVNGSVTGMANYDTIIVAALVGAATYRVFRGAASTNVTNVFTGTGSVKLALAAAVAIQGQLYYYDASNTLATEFIDPDSVCSLTVEETLGW